jgi:hypothetical protein
MGIDKLGQQQQWNWPVLNALDLTAFGAYIETRKRSKLREKLGASGSVSKLY